MLKRALFSSERFQWVRRFGRMLAPHKTVLALTAGAGLCWATLHCSVIRPMQNDVQSISRQLDAMNGQMQRLAGKSSAAHSTSDLLSALAAQEESLDFARQSLTTIRQLRADVEQEGRRATETRVALAELQQLQQQTIDAGARVDALQAALARVDTVTAQAESLQQSVALHEAGINRATDIVLGLGGLKDAVLQAGEQLPEANDSLTAVATLQDTLVAQSGNTAEAQARANALTSIAATLEGVSSDSSMAATEHAARLVAIHDLLADENSLQLQLASQNLQSLIGTHTELLRTTPELADAAENLELMSLLQDELSRELHSLQSLRHDLTEVTLLGDTVDRLVVALAPLREIADLQRLDADQVRQVAREILHRRVAELPTPMSSRVPVMNIGDSLPVTGEGSDIVVPEPMDAE